ncbi:MAG: glycogen synthase GlgA [Planctomycetaceae bacterium]|nr:glycogen synthase GlgA [Planctomycetaceae bacterium]
MRILIASSEAVPFAKTGGLADVATGLAKALAAEGHDVCLVIPCHRKFISEDQRGEVIGELNMDMRNFDLRTYICRTTLENSNVEVLLIDQQSFFDRKGLYGSGNSDYPDNAERFILFSRAVIEVAKTVSRPHVIHANDWQTGILPAMVHHERTQGRLAGTGSVLTIHNMAFHGQFPAWQMELTGLPWEYFNWQQLEYYGHLNLLKGGIAVADIVTTVSPTYAREICRPEYGYGLDPLLLKRGDSLVGILNGVDTEVWNPVTDKHLTHHFCADTFETGKPLCKASLQEELGLDVRRDALLFGMVSRLTDQKGLDLISAKADEILRADVQLAFLGTGDPHYENALRDLQARYPGRVSATIGFDEGLAHRIEAGSDAYLMPSRFEPCGLNQQYSLIYGAMPLVHSVGGLEDSVIDASEENIESGIATGIKFTSYHPDAFLEAVWRMVGLYVHRRNVWNQIARTGMSQDLSWNHSAQRYVEVYCRAIDAARS